MPFPLRPAALALAAAASLPASHVPPAVRAECALLPRTGAPEAQPNDNRAPAGRVVDGATTVRLVITPTTWYPEGSTSCGVPVLAFAEEGKAPEIPGPLLRVRQGTEIRATVRNASESTVWLRGMQDHVPPMNDTVAIAPGATRELRFRPTAVGAFLYAGRTLLGRPPYLDGDERGGQLVGALIVDSAAAPRAPNDRVLVLTRWADSTAVDSDGERFELNAVNGRAWPLTERMTYTVGDTVRWRVLSATMGFFHVMHLHGFYFRVDGEGSLQRDSIFPAGERPNAVSAQLGPLSEVSFTWVPDRAGNWLFHCHLLQHITAAQRLPRMRPRGSAPRRLIGVGFPSPADAVPDTGDASHAEHASAGHTAEAMSGLVVGIHVRPARGRVARRDGAPPRALRLLADMREGASGERPRFAFVLQSGDREPARDSLVLPGSPIVLTQGEPARIAVVNRLDRPLSVHWHGIELESYYDGVSGWSGAPGRLAPAIQPGDSFVVHMTPPRAGTFMYHTHGESGDELALGLYGPLLVLPRGERWDPEHDRLVVIADHRGAGGPTAVNGTATPAPWTLRAGAPYRIRIIDIARGIDHDVTIERDSSRATWRAIARDGAELPSSLAREGPALARVGPGITNDFVFTPADTGRYSLVVRTRSGRIEPVVMPLIVR
jgi:FtsP/CotA-like multicopper oxidase with cupredoxin domain